MLISDSKKFIFIHISKTAGTSVRAGLEPYSNQAPCDKLHSFLRYFDLPRDYRRFKFSKHAYLSAAQKKLPADVYDHYLKFAVVRNTWDRLVSSYHSDYGLKSGRNPDKKYREPIEFFDYLQKQRQRRNFQLERIINSSGQVGLDFMLRFENLNNDVQTLAEKLDIEIELPHRNYSFREKDSYQDYYDEQARDYVAEHWAQEIEILGYQF